MTEYEQMAENLKSWFMSFGYKLLVAVIIIIVGWWAIWLILKAVKKILNKSRADDGATSFIVSVLRVVLWIIILVTALGEIVNISSLVAALGAAGLTASFALQGSLGNFIGGMQIIFSKPYSSGDVLRVDGEEGTVSRIDVMNTRLVTFDNRELIIPNSKMTSGMVINYSSQKKRRLDLKYSISYDSDIDLAKATALELAKSDKRVFENPEALVFVGELKDSSVELILKLWCDFTDYYDIYYSMQENIKKEFSKKGIKIPYPQLEIHQDK